MGTEACPECGHLTKVYSDAGKRQHEEGCSLAVLTDSVPQVGDRVQVVGVPHGNEFLIDDGRVRIGDMGRVERVENEDNDDLATSVYVHLDRTDDHWWFDPHNLSITETAPVDSYGDEETAAAALAASLDHECVCRPGVTCGWHSLNGSSLVEAILDTVREAYWTSDDWSEREAEWRSDIKKALEQNDGPVPEDDPRQGRTVVDTVGEPHPFDPTFCGEGCQPVEQHRDDCQLRGLRGDYRCEGECMASDSIPKLSPEARADLASETRPRWKR